MKKLHKPKVVGTHIFPMILTQTEEQLSDDGKNALVLIRSAKHKNDIIIQIAIKDGRIETNVSTDNKI